MCYVSRVSPRDHRWCSNGQLFLKHPNDIVFAGVEDSMYTAVPGKRRMFFLANVRDVWEQHVNGQVRAQYPAQLVALDT